MDINIFEEMMKFEEGELSEERTIKLFQSLINSGDVWKLQGFYGRTAQSLIDDGLCSLPDAE